MKTETILTQYLLEHAEHKLCSIKRTRSCVVSLTKHLGHLEHGRLSEGALARYRASEGLKASSINREFNVLRAALKHAVKKQRIRTEPAIPKLTAEDPKTITLNVAQTKRLLVAAQRYPAIYAFIRLALHTGQRLQAILQLRWTQVDTRENVIWFSRHDLTHGKRRKGRGDIPISPGLAKLLCELHNDSPYVLASPVGMRYQDITRYQWRQVIADAGLPGLRPHDLRHTVATTLIDQGKSLLHVSRFLGHLNTLITEKIYVARKPEMLADAASGLDCFAD